MIETRKPTSLERLLQLGVSPINCRVYFEAPTGRREYGRVIQFGPASVKVRFDRYIPDTVIRVENWYWARTLELADDQR